MKLDTSKYLDRALEIANKAGEYLLKNFGKVKEAQFKSEGHYSIEDDQIVNNLYEKFLTTYTPEVALYTEEGQQNLDSELVWVVDPIEGTSNYRVGVPFFATQICLLYQSEPIVSVVYAPILNQTFHAVKSSGAYMNNELIQVDRITDLSQALITLNKGTEQKYKDWYATTLTNVLPYVRTIRSYGSCGLELSYVAAGMIDIFLGNGSQLYDYAPGSLILKEAGLVVTDLTDSPWTTKSNSFVAAEKKLHEQVFNVLNKNKNV